MIKHINLCEFFSASTAFVKQPYAKIKYVCFPNIAGSLLMEKATVTSPEKFLLPEEDGLLTRKSQDYVRYKLNSLAYFIEATNVSMRNHWSERYYLDLFSGPGKNNVEEHILLGSPLRALTAKFPATHFWLNELDSFNKTALEQRVNASPLQGQVTISQDNANQVVHQICKEIRSRNQKTLSLNMAFLDPAGHSELHWTTVEELARITKMDLIINFPTQGIIRNVNEYPQTVDQFFGTTEWRKVYKPEANPVTIRRTLIDFYRERLKAFGYIIDIDPNLGGDDIAVNNSKNAQVYSMIFASKHELGAKFWKAAARSVKPPKLPGFD
jgi:three-Cys-motif partner protein